MKNFGAFRGLNGIGQLTVVQMQQLTPFLRLTDPDYPIVSKILNDPRRCRIFVAHMKTIIADWFANNRYRDRALEIQDVIDSWVQADPNKFYTYNDFLNNINRSVGSGPLAIVGLTELMNHRVNFLLSQPEFRAAAPVIAEVCATPAQPAPNSMVQFLARVESADSVFLGYRQNPERRFCWTNLFDDGAHGDGAAGDGVYGTAVPVRAGEIHYYVYAENSAAGSFYPQRAEHEFINLPVSGGVVLNEIMADNVRTARDPSGEYDDWIELYNNTDVPISLDGYLLSDDSSEIGRWSFPDVMITGRGYLIVWADNDTGQPGLHANFQLNKSGELLILSDPDGRRLDQLVFGPQTADISSGRYPNGVGTFRLMNPTYMLENDSGVGAAEWERAKPVRLLLGALPNPFVSPGVIRYNLPPRGRVSPFKKQRLECRASLQVLQGQDRSCLTTGK
ncbi:MAG: lamin tail domain-containing protein [bacterium]